MRVIDLSTLSMVGGSGIVESKIPFWFADGTYAQEVSNAPATSFFDEAVTGSHQNFILSSNWSSNLQFALEVTIYTNNSIASANAQLYDCTTSSLVSGSSVTTTSTTAVMVRSGKFTLIPGHGYGVSAWLNESTQSYYEYLIDASLIVFPQ